ncbi:deleted in azoospermia-like [Sigmodon hispidus]
MMNPITQYVQTYPSYLSSPVQLITGYQPPVYNYQAYTTVNCHCSCIQEPEVDSGAEVLPNECSVPEATPASENGPKSLWIDWYRQWSLVYLTLRTD